MAPQARQQSGGETEQSGGVVLKALIDMGLVSVGMQCCHVGISVMERPVGEGPVLSH